MGLEVRSEELEAVLVQLETSLGTASEADSAKVQLVASSALGMVCTAVHEAAQQLQQPAAAAAGASGTLGSRCSSLQQHLSALQTALLQYQQAGLSFVIDLSSSMVTDELPEAAAKLEDLLEQHNAAGSDDAQLRQALQQQQQQQQQGSQQHAWVAEAAGKMQLLQQLLAAIKYEAVAQLAPWAAAAAESGDNVHASDGGAAAAAAPAGGGGLVMLQAGPVSQLQCWNAANALVAATWQQLHHLLQQSLQLDQQMQALAALAAAGGAAGIPATDSALLLQVEQLQQLLLPQGYDVAYAEDCVAAVQLLQVQWSELEQAFVRCLGACLCPILGLSSLGLEQWHGVAPAAGLEPGAANSSRLEFMGVDDQAVSVLQQVLAAAAAGIASGAAMHSKDVFDALAGSGAAAGFGGPDGTGSSSCSMWGTPEPAAAWKSLIALLLQCGCLQQQIQQQLGAAGADVADGSVAVGIDVLGSSTPLPLDLEQYRPLVFVVQVLNSLLQASADCGHDAVSQTAAATAAGPGLYERVEQLLVPAVSGCLLPQLHQQLGRLQQHLQLLGSEAAGVLQRLRHGGSSSGRAAGISGASQAQMDEPLEAGISSQGLGLGGEAADAAAWDAPDLVRFDAFDASLAGAGMLLEGGDELGGALEDEADLQAALESEDGALQQQGDMQVVLDNDEDDGDDDEDLDWLLEEQQAQRNAASSQQHLDLAAAAAGSAGLSGMPELVPFDAFDPSLPGAGAVLEGGGLELGGALEDDNSLEGDSNSLEFAGKQPTAAAGDAALALPHSAEWQELGQQLLSVGLQHAQQLQHQQQLAGLQQAGPSCDWQQQVWLRHLAAFEWLWGDLLQLQLEQLGQSELTQHLQELVQAAAVSLGMPVGDSSSTDLSEGAAAVTAAAVAAAAAAALKPGDAFQWYFSQLGLLQMLPHHPDQVSDSSCATLPLSHLLDPSGQSGGTSSAAKHSSSSSSSSAELRMPGRGELVAAWQKVAESLAGLEAGVTAWQEAAAAAAGGVKEAVARLAVQGGVLVGDPAVCFKVRKCSAPCCKNILTCIVLWHVVPTGSASTQQAAACMVGLRCLFSTFMLFKSALLWLQVLTQMLIVCAHCACFFF
jgi:hypothetical protein